MSDLRSRRWCFTLNNYKDHGWTDWQYMLKDRFQLITDYIVCEEEVGEQGTPHLQGYLKFKNQIRFSSLQNKFNGFAHLEVAQGSDIDNRNYCTKENGNVLEIGELNKDMRSKKTDWKKLIDDFCTMDFTLFLVKWPKETLLYFSKLQQLKYALNESKGHTCYNGELPSKNYWIYGAPGTGKSRWARQQSDKIYLKPVNKWWQNYINDSNLVLMEDFPCFEQTKGVLGQHMKLWADRYSFTAETKGGHLLVHPRDYVFIVTSNYSIEECFGAGDVEAIKRRFNEVMILGQNDIFFETKLDLAVTLQHE